MRQTVIATSLMALALGAGASDASAQQCGNAGSTGSLGVSLVECDCDIAPATTRREWSFRTEPRVRRIEAGSAASGMLQVDDVIFRVNGHQVTSEAGAHALSHLRPGQPVTLTILRNGVMRTEVLRPTSVCLTDPTLLGATPALERVRVAGTVVEAQRPSTAAGARGGGFARGQGQGQQSGQGQQGGAVARGQGQQGQQSGQGQQGGALPRSGGRGGAVAPASTPAPFGYYAQAPRAWIGIAFSCSDCTFSNSASGGAWRFVTPPEVYAVDPGSPAYGAGLRRGDVLTHINDAAITSEEGGRRWAQMRPGETVSLRYRRGDAARIANFAASAPRGGAALRTPQLRTIETALTRDSVANQEMQEMNRRAQETYARTLTRQRVSQGQLVEQIQEMQQYMKTQSPEEQRRFEELLAALEQSRRQNAEQDQQLAQLIRANRLHAERLVATQDSIERAITALRTLQAASAVTGEQRMRYAGSFAGTDIEVRGVSPVIVSETANEITIRIGETVVTLKRGRN